MAGYIGSKSSVTQVDGYSEAEADAEFVNDPNGAITVSGSNVGIGTATPSGKLELYGSGISDLPLVIDHAWGSSSTALISASAASSEVFKVERNGNVGIGTSSPSRHLHIHEPSTAGSYLQLTNTSSGTSTVDGFQLTASSTGAELINREATPLLFSTSNTEAMRIDSSGNLLVGTTDTTLYNNTTGTGTKIGGDGRLDVSRQADTVATFNRTGSSNGEVIRIVASGTTVGRIGNDGSNMYIGKQSGLQFQGNDIISPNRNGVASDNTIDLGQSSARFDDIYATNGTIQTSDFNEKQDIASLTATEMLIGKRISALFKTFRWKDSVAEKGANARTHTGVIAQDVQAAFTAEGLDAGDYALFISSTWWETQTDVPAVEAVAEVTDEDGNVTTEAVEAVDAYTRTDTYDTEAEAPEGATSKTRLGIRYPELLSFVAAYNEQRFASIEARLTALEA